MDSPTRIDYSDKNLWFEHSTQYIGKEIDIFYIYPTIDSTPLANDAEVPTFSDITQESTRKTASKHQNYNKVVYGDSDFNFFAPYYRQMTTKVFEMSKAEREIHAPTSYGDVVDAFQYYMGHYNNGRRYLLLGHSQGSQMLIHLLQQGMTEEQHSRMIAAYLMGFKITKKDVDNFPSRMKAAQGEKDQNVIITYNSVCSIEAVSPLLHENIFCINPLNWKTDDTPAEKGLHKGIVRYSKKEGRYVTTPHYTSARIQAHFLVCPDVDPMVCYKEPIKRAFPFGNLHFSDTWLFAANIKENMRKRTGLLE